MYCSNSISKLKVFMSLLNTVWNMVTLIQNANTSKNTCNYSLISFPVAFSVQFQQLQIIETLLMG